MSCDKATLDGLRIERRAPSKSSSASWFILLIIVLLLAGGGHYLWKNRTASLVVQTAVAKAQSSNRAAKTLLNASGYVTARRSATVSSKVTGKVTQISVEEGMKVEEGQVLARLDASNVEAGLRLAEAQLSAAKSLLEETKPNLAFAQGELKRF